MPPLDKPPMSPETQGQQPGPGLGPGLQQAQDQQKNDPIEMAVKTCEKLLMGISDETFKPYAIKAIGTLKVGLGMAKQKQPQAAGMGAPPPSTPGGGPPQVPTPPIPGQMPV